MHMNQASAAGKVTRLQCRWLIKRFISQHGKEDLPVRQSVQTGGGDKPAISSMGTEGKAATTSCWPITPSSVNTEDQWRHTSTPYMPTWHSQGHLYVLPSPAIKCNTAMEHANSPDGQVLHSVNINIIIPQLEYRHQLCITTTFKIPHDWKLNCCSHRKNMATTTSEYCAI